jgi:hypothetical protein
MKNRRLGFGNDGIERPKKSAKIGEFADFAAAVQTPCGRAAASHAAIQQNAILRYVAACGHNSSSCVDYSMGFRRFWRMMVLNVTGVDRNGHDWTPADIFFAKKCLTGFGANCVQRAPPAKGHKRPKGPKFRGATPNSGGLRLGRGCRWPRWRLAKVRRCCRW